MANNNGGNSKNSRKGGKRAERSVGNIPAPKSGQKAGTAASSSRSRRAPAQSQRIEPNWNRKTAHQKPNRGLLGGCGLFVVVIALLAIIALVGFLVAGIASKDYSGPERIPVPSNVPPAAAKPAPDINIHGTGRTAVQLRKWSEPIAEKTGIPVQALMAYGNAEVIARETRPECGITWNTLAGLGYVETLHGTYDGKRYGASKLNDKGFAEPEIFGPQLNGEEFARIEDSDDGKLDGDKEFDRAMGPMQFIPQAWETYGVDANGDGKSSPQNIDDAAAAAVRLLCDFDRNLASAEGWTRAIRAYNLSDEYVIKVRDAAANYALGQAPGRS